MGFVAFRLGPSARPSRCVEAGRGTASLAAPRLPISSAKGAATRSGPTPGRARSKPSRGTTSSRTSWSGGSAATSPSLRLVVRARELTNAGGLKGTPLLRLTCHQACHQSKSTQARPKLSLEGSSGLRLRLLSASLGSASARTGEWAETPRRTRTRGWTRIKGRRVIRGSYLHGPAFCPGHGIINRDRRGTTIGRGRRVGGPRAPRPDRYLPPR